MTQFIVLGQIPGTNYYIQFSTFMVFLAIILAVLLIIIRVAIPTKTKRQRIHQEEILSIAL